MRAPDASIVRVIAIFLRKDTPRAGAQTSDEAPPETSTRIVRASSVATTSRQRSAARTLRRSGKGCDATDESTTTHASIAEAHASPAPAAIARAAFPIA